jgi:hypothetical protein
MPKQIVIVATLFLASSAFASDRLTFRGDIVGSVLSTAYLGDTSKTTESMNSLAASYQLFLRDLQRESFCEMESRAKDACAKFRSNETAAIQKRVWSQTYSLTEAAFSGRTATYNFVRAMELPGARDCRITMQLSVDLDDQQILNDEFFARCQ